VDPFPEPATPTITSRRDFLKVSAQTLGLIGLGGMSSKVSAGESSIAQTSAPADRILVLIHLVGGNDGFNTVVPLNDERYHRSRATLAIKPEQALGFTEHHGFHPSCRGLQELYLNKRLAVLPQVSASSLSHFGASDVWDNRITTTKMQETGWLGRFLDQNARTSKQVPAAVHFSPQLPACLLSTKRHQIGSFTSPSPTVLRFPRKRITLAQKFPESRLGQNLQTAASLIANDAPTQIYHLTLTGFDTHSHQAGPHAYLLRTLSNALAAFDQSIQRSGMSDRVLTVVYSEFGRSLQENERLGTDHAPAGPVFLVGNYTRINLSGMLHLHADEAAQHEQIALDCRQVLSALSVDWLNCPRIVSPS